MTIFLGRNDAVALHHELWNSGFALDGANPLAQHRFQDAEVVCLKTESALRIEPAALTVSTYAKSTTEDKFLPGLTTLRPFSRI